MIPNQSDPTKIDPESFNAIAQLAYRESGLQLVAEKTSMIQSRLRNRLKAAGVKDFKEYAKFVCSDIGIAERRLMISALTTNVSHFFREQHHFDILSNQVLPSMISSLRNGRRFRLWSAGCSNGQEAFSVAMTVLECLPDAHQLDIKILATDIDPKVVDFGRAAVYPERLISGIPKPMLSKYFTIEASGSEPLYKATAAMQSMVAFKELNLLAKWPMKNEMDIIFCRNVVIYFDGQTQDALWPRFNRQLSPNGHLFLGHSERISDPSNFGFINDGPTSYRPTTASTS
ncbi:MAG: protein-glutamate O-methyltransferase CheR [Roseobacter sp.]